LRSILSLSAAAVAGLGCLAGSCTVVENLTMKWWAGALVGAAVGYALTLIAGAIWGGLYQVAPCYGGASYRPVVERILGGAVFGMLMSGFAFGLPVAAVGAVAGAINIWVRQRHIPPQGTTHETELNRVEVAPEELPTEDDLTEPTECLECHKTIPAGSAICPACGWSYK
jgi:hypothetical protein